MRRKKQDETRVFSEEDLKKEIMISAKSVGMPVGVSESIAEKVAKKVTEWVQGRKIITEEDLNKRIAKELQKYSQDLSYVYQNRGRII